MKRPLLYALGCGAAVASLIIGHQLLPVVQKMWKGRRLAVPPQHQFDVIHTDQGDLVFVFVGHASLYIHFKGKVIHIDPCSMFGDYAKYPAGDLVLFSHEHRDHFDPTVFPHIRKASTIFVASERCNMGPTGAIVMRNGDTVTLFDGDIKIEAIPAYNLQHMRQDGTPFHKKGEGNGYILTMGGKRILFAGDTENIPEIKVLKDIDIAFLPMNLPYTMTPEMVADAAAAFRPRVLYPYHYGETKPQLLLELMKTVPEVEVRVRRMK